MVELLSELLTKWPWVSYVLMGIGILRVVFKPLFSLAQQVALVTPSPKDDSVMASIMESKIYKGICWVLDYFASVKLPSGK